MMNKGGEHEPQEYRGITQRPLSLLPIVFLLFTLCYPLSSALALDVPSYKGYVNDYAEMISPAAETRLTQTLQDFDRTDSTQVAILTVLSLEGEDIEGFSIRVATKWGIGQKGKDNGVLLLVSKGDRKSRIEVGRGLEGVFTDLLSGRIVDQVIRPAFKDGRFDDGFEQATASIIKATRGEFKADPKTTHRSSKKSKDESGGLSYLVFFAIAVGIAGRLHLGLSIIVGALLLPLFAKLGLGAAISMFTLLLLFPAGAVVGLILALILRNSDGGGGFFLGGGGGGSGGGFGGFGGGGFGGGGASGDW